MHQVVYSDIIEWVVQCNRVAVMQLIERGQIIISN